MTGAGRTALSTGCVLLTVLACTPMAWAGPPVPGPPSYEIPRWHPPAPTRWQPARRPAADVTAAVNRHRTEAGCPPVRPRASLTRAAQAHSTDMARHRRLTHTGTDGSSPADRMRAAGYRPGRTGEALTAGPATAGAAVAQWMASAPHRAIILTCGYTDAGVGITTGPGGPWWTLDLAARR
ncbi:CAP domain-containing protein [Streptomyces sp. NPDC097941]|uniref:CAP domain-containing protein n=1 Tax=Streptomyces sp. NPDC097941 TaxID=3155685 RepID=UPI003318C9EF